MQIHMYVRSQFTYSAVYRYTAEVLATCNKFFISYQNYGFVALPTHFTTHFVLF